MRVRKRFRDVYRAGLSRWLLRDLDRIGRWSRVTAGRLAVTNHGRIEIGSRVRFMCELGMGELRTGTDGVLRIGDRVGINYGTYIETAGSVTIGNGVSIGPRCIISDSDFSVTDDLRAKGSSRSVVIGDGVWLASRVTVMPGVQIGEGSVITAGSIVDRDVPAGVLAGGTPIRTLRRLDDAAIDPSGEVLATHDPTVTPTDVRTTGYDTRQPDGGAPPSVVVAPPVDVATPAIAARGLLISDFTIDPLAAALSQRAGGVVADVAAFGTVVPTLLDPPTDHTDFAVVWTHPHTVLPAFQRRLDELDVDGDELLADVERFVELIRRGLGDFTVVFIPTWTIAPWVRGNGVFDLGADGVRRALARANDRLRTAVLDVDNAVVVDADRWLTTAGGEGYHERLWYLGKIPFDEAVFSVASEEIIAGIGALRGAARKLIVVDLDNTMWGGVVGDDGWQSLRLGGHDAQGEAFVDFQRGLLRLKRRGIALAIASKNEESVALEAIDRHDQMVLGRDDFVAWRINWTDKAHNVAEIVEELNLGLQSVVFIDDNPHERARVRSALPEVLVPDWPSDPIEYPRALASLTCFDQPATTSEDRQRTEMYATENRRRQLRESVGTLDDWIRDLDMKIRAVPLDSGNLERATQLLNKTNQMNLTTRRLAPDEFLAWAGEPLHETLCISVEDRIGDAGLTGVVSIATDGSTASLVDFVLSCRVFGRRVEEAMVHLAARAASAMGADDLVAEFVPTAKNDPCRRFFDGSVFERTDADRYGLNLARPTEPPADVTILRPAAPSPA